MTTHQISGVEYATAPTSGRVAAETEISARSVRYVSDRDSIEILTTRQAGFLIPRSWIDAPRDVPPEELTKLEVWPDGSAIELEHRDIHISVDGLITALLPTRTVAALFASRGGKATSDAKRSSARKSGQQGGRPRKAGKVGVG